jgi:hypothetical protein
MPRKSTGRRVEVNDSDIEEDYLEVDKPIPGQNFVCLSFVSPEKMITKKEAFYAYHYNQFRMGHYRDLLKTQIDAMLDAAGDGDSVPLEKIAALRKTLKTEFDNDIGDLAKYTNNVDDFKYREEEKLNALFDKENSFQTSVRGLKVRGVYDTKAEADSRAAALQRTDQSFDVFVGQVGYWLPWDPCTTKVQNQEYLDKDLNNLVKEYKANEAKKDMFYQEQKQSRAKDAISTADRLRHKLALKKQKEEEDAAANMPAVPEVSSNQQSVELGDIANVKVGLSDVNVDSMMNDDDPWMQAKQRQSSASEPTPVVSSISEVPEETPSV